MNNPENIRLFLPYYLATIGLIIGVAAMFAPLENRTEGFGLAGAAIAGAAGLAEPSHKN